MTTFQRRLFIFADEWLGAAVVLFLWKTHDPAFPFVGVYWLLAVYAISYPVYWRRHDRWWA